MILVFVIAAAAVLAISIVDWRRGLLLCLVVGFAQDPLRKLVPGRPVVLVVAVAVCFVACLVGLFASGKRLAIGPLLRLFPRVRPAAALFATVIFLQTGVTLVRTGNPILAGIGVLSYASPPLALLLAERYALDFRRLVLWLKWYLSGAVLVAASVLLQYVGWQSVLVSSVGYEWVYGRTGAVRMLNGLMRTSEIAAWHIAAGACVLATLAVAARRPRVRWLGGATAAAMVVAVFLTGRRKMLAEIALFAVLYALLVIQYRRGGSRVLQFLGAGAVLTLIASQLGLLGEQAPLGAYVERGFTVFTDAGDRLEQMTIGVFGSILGRNGILGSGAGTGAQGSQYFGGGTALVGGAVEGGLGKVLAELGLPGLFALLWLGFELARVVLRIARLARHEPSHRALALYGLIAFLPANAAVFLTAHQVFGDPFVLIVLGLISGSILAYPRLAHLERRRDATAAARTPQVGAKAAA